VAEDVGTLDSGLNSMVLACNSESVLLPINEPTFGTRRKSQIQTYLEHNEGPGVQHIALKTDDIFHTLRRMRSVRPPSPPPVDYVFPLLGSKKKVPVVLPHAHTAGWVRNTQRTESGGFDFMPSPSKDYYLRTPARVGENVLTEAQWAECEELGILVDKDDQGVLLQVSDVMSANLERKQQRESSTTRRSSPGNERNFHIVSQAVKKACTNVSRASPLGGALPLLNLLPPSQIFTKPLGDRPTVFVEVIQRVGCMASSPVEPAVYQQTPGCGGFGKGNFSELFKSIEDYERTLDAVDA
jgi:4-hydroxyphenylpyruvate dioxygenase-like putative hemolysin